MQVSWANASLTQTVRGATEPYDNKGAGRFTIDGPDIRITSSAVIALAMTLNELCTNTTKFGALSVSGGSSRSCLDDRRWHAAIAADLGRKGRSRGRSANPSSFGTRMMETLGQQLNGKVHLAYERSGSVYTLDAPVQSLTVKM